MMSRVWIYIFSLLLAASVASPAFADAAPAAPTSAWEQWTAAAKVKVNEWIAYWKGGTQPAAPAVVAEPTPKPVAPAASAQPTAPTAPTAVAPVAPAAKPVVAQPKAESVMLEKAKGSSLQDVQALRDSLKSKSLLSVAKEGRAGTSKLAKNKAGIPVVDWSKLKGVKHIQRLDIGTESLISAEDFKMSSLSWGIDKPSELKKLPSPAAVDGAEVRKLLATPVAKAFGQRGLQANIRTVGRPVTHETVDKVTYNLDEIANFKELPYKPLSEEQLKMVAALILFDRGNHCHMIMGLFHQLASAEKTKIEATYHLGACAAQLKMSQSAFENLSKVVKSEDKEFAPEALGILSKDLLVIYETDFYHLVKGLKNPKALITDKTRDEISYRVAKGAFRAKDYKTALAYVKEVSPSSEFIDDARFLTAMNNFALGDKAQALKQLQDLWANLETRKGSNTNIRALTGVNLARMYFAQKKYDKALSLYMQVPKDHPLWVQALIEQGWTQIALEDYSGAIGNMYSLHSPYFKAVYQPESFVVRTIGYLNICQYGDAYRSLSFLEKDYRDWDAKTTQYLSTKGNPDAIYETVKNYIRGKSSDDVEGVPYQVWREMAHRKDFLNLQTAMNDKADEGRRYEGVNTKIKLEKASIRARADASKKHFDDYRTLISKTRNDKTQASAIAQLQEKLKYERDMTIAYRFQLAILEQSREGYLDFQKKSQASLDAEAKTLGHNAGDMLLTHAKHMQKEMSQLLDNNEFLRYEVFSGSGENIRYQVAGGKVDGKNRVPASIKPTKMMNWNFDGEFWEDEIGSYRSSLQNNCPVNQMANKPVAAPATEQARHVDEDEN